MEKQRKKAENRAMKDEQGAIILEATISLPIFMFTILTLLSIVNICVAQAKMGTFINEAAKEFSKYSYLCVATGISEKHADVAKKGTDAKEAVNTVLSQNNGLDFIAKASEFAGNVAGDSEFRQSLLAFLGNAAVNKVESKTVGMLVKEMSKTRFTNGTLSGEAYQKFLRIRNVDYDESKFMPDGSSDIQIVASYDVHVIKLLGIDIKLHFTQCAKTKAWGKI